MKVLITGGCGYIGESVFALLNQKIPGLTIVNYDNLLKNNYSFFINNKFPNLNAVFERGDLLDTKKIIKIIQDVDVVVHLAGMVTTPFADHTPHLFEQNNHWGTSSLMTAIEQSNVRRVIYLSTATVYGNIKEPATEDRPPNPETFYCISKYQAEKQLGRIKDEREVYILRSGNVYGYNTSMRMDAFINKFMFEGHFLNKIKVIGRGEQSRPVIHVDKLASVIVDLLTSDQSPGIYNVAEYNFSVNYVANRIKEIYPNMDIVYASQNMPMRNLELALPCSLHSQFHYSDRSFEEELMKMSEQFAFLH